MAVPVNGLRLLHTCADTTEPCSVLLAAGFSCWLPGLAWLRGFRRTRALVALPASLLRSQVTACTVSLLEARSSVTTRRLEMSLDGTYKKGEFSKVHRAGILGFSTLYSWFSVRFLMPFTQSSHPGGLGPKTCGETNRRYSLHTGGMSLPTILSPLWVSAHVLPASAGIPFTCAPLSPRRKSMKDDHLRRPAGADPLRGQRRVRRDRACTREGQTRDLERATAEGVGYR